MFKLIYNYFKTEHKYLQIYGNNERKKINVCKILTTVIAKWQN